MLTEDTYITVVRDGEHMSEKINDVIDDFISGEVIEVLSHNGKKITQSTVSNTRSSDCKDFISIQFKDTKSLVVTPEHKVYMAGTKEWKKASELAVGQQVLTSLNEHKEITSLHVVRDKVIKRILALAVSPDQSYFANDVLVHNES